MKVLFIGAHQDDNEIDRGGLAIRLLNKGHTIKFLSMCNGCGGHHIMTPEETTATRAKESARVAEELGIVYDVWSDMDDCSLTADLETRRRLIRYIREFSPDMVIAHRPNDYHADHRASGQLVMDASYMLVVPHECPDVPAMKEMPVIMYSEDRFKDPEFRSDVVVDIDNEIDRKIKLIGFSECQVYEWLPYTNNETVPEKEEERFEWLKGMDTKRWYSDKELESIPRGWALLSAKTAARFRKELIKTYGRKKGAKVRYAEAYQVCEYGTDLKPEMRKEMEEV